jgi:hypothetical protein
MSKEKLKRALAWMLDPGQSTRIKHLSVGRTVNGAWMVSCYNRVLKITNSLDEVVELVEEETA